MFKTKIKSWIDRDDIETHGINGDWGKLVQNSLFLQGIVHVGNTLLDWKSAKNT